MHLGTVKYINIVVLFRYFVVSTKITVYNLIKKGKCQCLENTTVSLDII